MDTRSLSKALIGRVIAKALRCNDRVYYHVTEELFHSQAYSEGSCSYYPYCTVKDPHHKANSNGYSYCPMCTFDVQQGIQFVRFDDTWMPGRDGQKRYTLESVENWVRKQLSEEELVDVTEDRWCEVFDRLEEELVGW